MNAKRCEKIMETFLRLDKNERLPVAVTLHLLFCRKCRSEVRLCTLAEKTMAKPLAVELPLDSSSLAAVMKVVYPGYEQSGVEYKPITLKRWILSGIFMIAAMVPFNIFTGIILPGGKLTFVFYLLFGCIITVYCALFVGSNLDFFVKKISTRHTLRHAAQ